MRRRKEDLIVVIGLTGGIACGKSAVARLLHAEGLPVVDADRVARDVVAPGTPGFHAVVEVFGSEVVLPDGALDRRLLGERVFADPSARARLEAITHPDIALASAAEFQRLAAAGHGIVIYEAALLVETGRHRQFPGLIVVTTSPEVQLARLLARDPDLTNEAALARIAAQMPLADKVREATWVVDNDGDFAALERAVHGVAVALRGFKV